MQDRHLNHLATQAVPQLGVSCVSNDDDNNNDDNGDSYIVRYSPRFFMVLSLRHTLSDTGSMSVEPQGRKGQLSCNS